MRAKIGTAAAAACLAIALVACDGGKPECSGMVTADLGLGATPGCTGAWVHGEQLCTQWASLCPGSLGGVCMAFGSWDEGTCECPAVDEAWAAIDIVDPPDGASISAADDVDATRAGIQIRVTVDTSCLAAYAGGWTLEVANQGYEPLDPGGMVAPDSSGTATAILDLGGGTGCRWVEARGHFESMPEGYAHAFIMTDYSEVCVVL